MYFPSFNRENKVIFLETIIKCMDPVTKIIYFDVVYTVRHISCKFLFTNS